MENGFKSISQSLSLAEVMHVNKSKYLVDSGIQCEFVKCLWPEFMYSNLITRCTGAFLVMNHVLSF